MAADTESLAQEQRMVEINPDIFEELAPIAKRERTSVRVVVNELLAAWLGRVG